MSVRVGIWLAGALAVAALLAAPAASSGYTFKYPAVQAGAEETVFDWDGALPPEGRGRCNRTGLDLRDDWHVPDTAMRAFRDASNRVQMIMSHAGSPTLPEHTRRIMTPPGVSTLDNLDDLKIDCKVIMSSGRSDDPGTYNNWEWLMSPYTEDGQTIHALVHNEYHGWETEAQSPGHPDGCMDPGPPPTSVTHGTARCWHNSITLATSTDGGESYGQQFPPIPRVATFPYKYQNFKGRTGYVSPSNIVKKDNAYYAVTYADNGGAPLSEIAQQRGLCLIRTETLSDPSSWRAYDGDPDGDGNAFETTFMDPYRPEPGQQPQDHVCKPVLNETGTATSQTGAMMDSLTYNTFLDRYLLVGVFPDVGSTTRGVWYSLSKDLIKWTKPELLVEAPIFFFDLGDTASQTDTTCTAGRQYGYPSVIDPNAVDRSFSTSGQFNHLYLTSFNDPDCRGPNGEPLPVDRDLVRIPFRFRWAARWATGAPPTCEGGFDEVVEQLPSTSFRPAVERNFDVHPGSYIAHVADASKQYAYGLHNKQDDPPQCPTVGDDDRRKMGISRGDELWYSAAFTLPSVGFWNMLGNDPLANVTLMTVDGNSAPYAGPRGGTLLVNKNHQFRFVTSDGTTTYQVLKNPSNPNQNGAPVQEDNCWHLIEIHQVFGTTRTTAVNEIWMDGTPQVTDRTAPNFPADRPELVFDKLRAGIVARNGAGNTPLLYTDTVGFGWSAGPVVPYLGCGGFG